MHFSKESRHNEEYLATHFKQKLKQQKGCFVPWRSQKLQPFSGLTTIDYSTFMHYSPLLEMERYKACFHQTEDINKKTKGNYFFL